MNMEADRIMDERKQNWYAARVEERFLRYAAINTQSSRKSRERPSSRGQKEMLYLLKDELSNLGVSDAVLINDCYLIARIPASSSAYSKNPAIGFMAHVDTSEDVCGKGVTPQVIRSYDGSNIPLPGADSSLSMEDNPELKDCLGKDIITTDGKTLLGADDKAGVAEIMTALEYIVTSEEIEHGPVEAVFTTDEETGTGMDEFPQEKLQSICCYTLDGSGRGFIETECFNAVKADIRFSGVSYHLGKARGRLVNAVSMAGSFMGMLPRSESPEATDGRYGYYCVLHMEGNLESASLEVFIRDFTKSGAKRRIETLSAIARAVESSFPGGKVKVDTSWQYENMAEGIRKNPKVLKALEQALDNLGIPVQPRSIRGGTDGARLTALGIPTPNIFTGGYNFHSRYEWACIQTMAEAAQVVEELVRIWAEGKRAD